MTANQIDMQLKKIKYQENKQAKELFEEDLRKSVNKTVNSGTGLFGANKNIFDQDLTKDSQATIKLNRRKHIMKQDMVDMITNLNKKDFDSFESTMLTFQLTKKRLA